MLYVSLGPRMFFGPHSAVHATVPAINGNLPNLKHSRIGADGYDGEPLNKLWDILPVAEDSASG